VSRYTQDKVIAEIEAKGLRPGPVHKYKFIPFIAMAVDEAVLDALISSPDVITIEEDIIVPPALDMSVPRIGASQLHEKDITGAGITVVILDTGVDKTHPFLLGSVVSEACYSSNDGGSTSLCPGGVDTSTAEGSALPYGGSCPPGECDHGTHVAGIVAGRSGVSMSPGAGVAPEANIIAIQVFSRFDSSEDCDGQAPCVMSWSSDQLKALERAYELRSAYTVASVNMSLGGNVYTSYCDSIYPAMKSTIDNLRAAGIATVIASGNSYACGGISFPACISSAVSVGATYVDIYDTEGVASYSNSSSFLSLLAPGSQINSSIPWGVYTYMSGTSMAAPHVAGSWALIKQGYPGATVEEIMTSLTSTGLSITDQGCAEPIRKKRIDVNEAYTLLSGYANLNITKSGVGTGTVKSSLPGIDCGEDCVEFLPRDSMITLTAIADRGSEFGGWSGGGCSGTDPCQLTLSTSSSVTALFRKEASLGTEFLITGFDFGDSAGKVLIGDVTAKKAHGEWNTDSISATVSKIPAESPGIFSLTIIPREKGVAPVYIEDAIVIKGPQISDADYRGAPGYPILIQGNFFGTKKQKVFLEYMDSNGRTRTRRCMVPSWHMDTTTGDSRLVFITPKNLAPGLYTLKVTNKVGTAESSFIIEAAQ
jgi:hypothetical protein